MRKHFCGLVVIAPILLTGLLTDARAGSWRVEAAHQLEQRLQLAVVSEVRRCGDPRFDLHAALVRFYRYRGFEPAWVDRFGLRPEGAMALSTVSQASHQGLRYTDYQDPWLDALLDGMLTRPVILGSAFDGHQVQLDLVVSAMVLHYAWHCAIGRSDPKITGFDRSTAPDLSQDLAVALAEALAYDGLEAFFARLGPGHAPYRALLSILPRYLRMARAGGWTTIADGTALQIGDCGWRVGQLRNRLAASGDAPPSESQAPCFDDDLAAAVAHFQRRHGLDPDGVVGARTLAALNVPVGQRIRQIQLSLERWRWMPAELGPRYVLVNIPGFEMQVVEAGQVVKTMRTIVGRPKRPTPVLASMISYLEINPYWHVPPKIAREDLLPKIQQNPDFLIQQNFRVFDSWKRNARELDPAAIDWSALSADDFPWRLRQEPAGPNALGRVKFVLPNPWSVYIHDTPAKGLFRKPSRPFSSGCVRVEEPLALMDLLLKPQGWDAESVSAAVRSNERRVVMLDTPVPVYLVYLTAWVDAAGAIHFREDIYGDDARLAQSLARPGAARPTCSTIMGPPATYQGETVGPDRQDLQPPAG